MKLILSFLKISMYNNIEFSDMSDLFYINTRICFKGLQGDIRIGLFVRSDIRDKGIQGNWDLA